MLKMSELQLQNYRNMYNEGKLFSTIDLAFMLAHIDAIEQEKQRLIDNVAKLQGELQLERESKLVKLPKELAEAIDGLMEDDERFNYTTPVFDILAAVDQSMSRESCHRDINTIAKWINEDYTRKDIVVQALVNGYTIEEPPSVEDKLRTEWTPILEEILEEYTGNGESVPLTQSIIDKMLPLTRNIIKAMELEQYGMGGALQGNRDTDPHWP